MIPFEMYLFKYGVILGILDLLKLLGKKIYVCIYIYSPNDGLPWALESVKKHRLNKSTASVFQKKTWLF